MKRKKRFPAPPPKHGTYLGGHIFTVKPIENEPDPSKMIDVWCNGSHHFIVDVPDDRVPPLLPTTESWPSPPDEPKALQSHETEDAQPANEPGGPTP